MLGAGPAVRLTAANLVGLAHAEMYSSAEELSAGATHALKPQSATWRVCLVDLISLVRQGLRAILAAQDDFEVVAEFDSLQALRAAGVPGDIVVFDVRLNENVIAQLHDLTAATPGVRWILLTRIDSSELWLKAMRAGIHAVLLKHSPNDLIVASLRSTALGSLTVDETLLRSALERNGHEMDARTPQLATCLASLSARERAVLRLLALGYKNKAISQELCLSPVTVRKYVHAMVHKLGLTDRTQAALLAQSLGLADHSDAV
jgi:DNA-binding NarL/FixJ family response regulator